MVEKKAWKSMIHETTQSFIPRPLFNLCGLQTLTENLSFSVLLALSYRDTALSEAKLLTQYACPELQRMGE